MMVGAHYLCSWLIFLVIPVQIRMGKLTNDKRSRVNQEKILSLSFPVHLLQLYKDKKKHRSILLDNKKKVPYNGDQLPFKLKKQLLEMLATSQQTMIPNQSLHVIIERTLGTVPGIGLY